jgi:hypothetical protein
VADEFFDFIPSNAVSVHDKLNYRVMQHLFERGFSARLVPRVARI